MRSFNTTPAYSDPDGDALSKIKITSLPSHGTLTLSGSGVSVNDEIAAANIGNLLYTPQPNYNGPDSFGYNASDGKDYALVSKSVNITIIAVNDRPVLAGIEGTALSYKEGDAATAITSSITVSDVDNTTQASATVSITSGLSASEDVLSFTNNGSTMGNIASSYNSTTGVLTLTSAGATATLAHWQSALRAVKYKNTSSNPSTAARTVSFVINDGSANSTAVTRNIAVTAVNNPPVIASIEGTALSYKEGDAATAITSSITVSDVDNTTQASATVSITNNFASGEDVLSFTNNGSTMGNIASSYNSTTGVLTLTSAGATATLAQWQSALRVVKYKNTSSNPSTAARTVSFIINDGSANSTAVTRNIAVTAVNNPPVIASIEGTALSYKEGDAATAISGTITVADVDNTTQASAMVSITSGLSASEDVLSFTNDGSTMGNIVSSYNSTTGVLTLTSAGATASLAQWQSALRAVKYKNTSSNPSTAARTVSFYDK